MTNELVINDNTILALDDAAKSGLIANSHASLFKRAALIATATNNLMGLLTQDVVSCLFMPLQGKKIGFKTDKPYGWQVVRDCVIEAVMTGVDVTGNEFNIIAGNCYITKEGMSHLLSDIDGLKYSVTPGIPSTNNNQAIIKMLIEWDYQGDKAQRELDIVVRVNKAMGSDAIIGKATRKARAWLVQHITGQEIGDGDADDIKLEKQSKYSTTDTLDVKAEVVEQITVEQIVEAVGMSEEDITMHFKLKGTGSWAIEKLSDLSQANMQKILEEPEKMRAYVENTKQNA